MLIPFGTIDIESVHLSAHFYLSYSVYRNGEIVRMLQFINIQACLGVLAVTLQNIFNKTLYLHILSTMMFRQIVVRFVRIIFHPFFIHRVIRRQQGFVQTLLAGKNSLDFIGRYAH